MNYFRRTQPSILTPQSLTPPVDQRDSMPTAELSVKRPDADICLSCVGSRGMWVIGKDDIGRFQKCSACNGTGRRRGMPTDS